MENQKQWKASNFIFKDMKKNLHFSFSYISHWLKLVIRPHLATGRLGNVVFGSTAGRGGLSTASYPHKQTNKLFVMAVSAGLREACSLARPVGHFLRSRARSFLRLRTER